MEIVFFTKGQGGRCPVKDFLNKLQTKDRAKVLACLKSVEDLGLDSPRVQFRQIRDRLWEIKIKSTSGGFRIFYVCLKKDVMVLLHGYQKQSQKAPKKEIDTALRRMTEVLSYEKDYIR